MAVGSEKCFPVSPSHPPMKQTLLSSATLLIGLGALSNKPAVDEVDLSLRFEMGQTFTVTSSSEVDMALDELSVMVDGAEVLAMGSASSSLPK